MAEKQEIIIRYHREGASARKISRDLGLSRKTVSKYIAEYEQAMARQPSDQATADTYPNLLSTAPVPVTSAACMKICRSELMPI